MNELYPLKFKPILKDKIWGGEKLSSILHKNEASPKCGESWEISTYEGNISVVSEGFLEGNNLLELIEIYMGDLLGDSIYERFGIEFPLLIKYIDASQILSIQVHPDDETALKKHNSYGKTEMWYVIDAEKDAELITGFSRTIDKEIYLSHFKSGKLQEILNVEKVHPGDCFFMPAGRIHTIGAGILLAEIQQTSDLTYRIYDFGRKDEYGKERELHLDLALDVIDFNHHPDYRTEYARTLNTTVNLVDCPYFTTNIIQLDKPVKKDFTLVDSFVIYMCPGGSARIFYNEGLSIPLTRGETVLIPAQMKNIWIEPTGNAELLEIYVKI